MSEDWQEKRFTCRELRLGCRIRSILTRPLSTLAQDQAFAGCVVPRGHAFGDANASILPDRPRISRGAPFGSLASSRS